MTPAAVDLGMIAGKLRLMRGLLDDLAAAGEVTAERLADDRMLRHAIERVLTQLVDLAVSVNSHVASARLGRAPASYRESFALAAQAGVIDAELAARLAPAAGLRNILVHEYAEVDLRQVAAGVPLALRDFSAYVTAVARAVRQ